LKTEIEVLKNAPGALAATTQRWDLTQMTKEQLVQKLLSYQQFMAEYIVESQKQKIQAIAAAEHKIKQQYEGKLRLLTGSANVVDSTPEDTSPTFEQRSAKVSAAAAAGKSRWGDRENEKAIQASGSVNGAVKANGASAPSSLAAPPSSKDTASFQKRSAMVTAAGKTGKSRWGEVEVSNASHTSPSLPGKVPPPPVNPAFRVDVPEPPKVKATDGAAVPVPPKVEAADHGLRADGGVGVPSLAERVNFGAQLMNEQTTAACTPT
jgi:hypothetical protein